MTQINLVPIIPKRLILGSKAEIFALFGKVMRNTVTDGQRFIATYPTQTLTKTGYRRTGTLKRSWSSEVHSGSNIIEGIVGSNSRIAPYNEYVQGSESERVKRFDAAGWRGIDDLADRMGKKLVKDVQDGIDNMARRSG